MAELDPFVTEQPKIHRRQDVRHQENPQGEMDRLVEGQRGLLTGERGEPVADRLPRRYLLLQVLAQVLVHLHQNLLLFHQAHL